MKNLKSIFIGFALVLIITSAAYAQTIVYLPFVGADAVPGASNTTPTVTPTFTIEPTSTPIPTGIPTTTPTLTIEPTLTPFPTVTPTFTIESTSTPIPTSTPTTTPTLTIEPTSTPVPTNTPSANVSLLPNGDFELGRQVWAFDGSFLTTTFDSISDSVRNGVYAVVLGSSSSVNDTIIQRITVPTDRPFLSYWYTASSAHATCFFDSAFVSIDLTPDDSDFSQEIVDSHFVFCNEKEHRDYRQNIVDLQAYAGQEIELEFRMSTDSGYASFWTIDDITFQSANTLGIEPIPTNTPIPSSSLLPNGDFEQGETIWAFEEGATLTNSPGSVRGIYSVHLGGENNGRESIRQQVTIPTDKPFLSYWYTAVSGESTCYNDTATVWISADSSINDISVGILDSHYIFCDEEEHSDWRKNVIPLHTYAGQEVELEFAMRTDSSMESYWIIDDISFQTQNAPE